MKEEFSTIFSTFGGKQGDLIPVLQKVQAHFGYLSEESMLEVAKFLKVPESKVFATASFYAQLRFNPVGRYLIKVCHGTACHVQNAQTITETLENSLDIKEGETTKDALFTLESVACVGCCSLAPVLMINENTHGKLAPKEISKILKEYQHK